MSVMALLILGHGPLQWSFPWWVWLLAIVHACGEGTVTVKRAARDDD
jgi:hypothetical protein